VGGLERLRVDRTATPLGTLLVVARNDRLCAAHWEDCQPRLLAQLGRRFPDGYVQEPAANPGGLTASLAAYFRGDLDAIDAIPIDPGGTPFQRAVWDALRSIPCGRTLTYAALAAAIGQPSAARAVGHANGANPVSIVVPCHRLVGANGSLTGYGGGIERKRWLLAHERGVGA
jgi:methylated-DNA-[protein]-cysteine S-methyltransferase